MDLKLVREEAIEATNRAFWDKSGFVPDEDSDEWEEEYRRQFDLAKKRHATERPADTRPIVAAAPPDEDPGWAALTGPPTQIRWAAALRADRMKEIRDPGIREWLATTCPSCGGAAQRESDTIDCHVDGMWMWMPIVVPFDDRPQQMFSHPDYQRWLPAKQIVWGADAGGDMFDQRLMHEMVRMDGRKMSKHLGNVVDPNQLVEDVGADTVRLAVLYAAAPGKSFNWNEQPVRYCQTFLYELWEYASPRLRDW